MCTHAMSTFLEKYETNEKIGLSQKTQLILILLDSFTFLCRKRYLRFNFFRRFLFQWCQNQKCVPMMEPPASIDGGWGDWGPWSECTRTCGSGVSVMERQCDHPRPAAGGRFCVGERKRYRICNSQPCPPGQPTFRAVQCTRFNNHTYEGKKYEWQPYFDQGNNSKCIGCFRLNASPLLQTKKRKK